MAASTAYQHSRSSTSTACPSYRPTTTASRPATKRSRPRTSTTSIAMSDNEIICSISESRGVTPTIGLSFVNISTCETAICQFSDTQTYARTCHKITVFSPSEIIYMSTSADSELVSIIRENLEVEKNNILMTSVDRRYWNEAAGHEYLEQLAFPADLESLSQSMAGNYFATCCFASALKYIQLALAITFAPQSLRIKFESSEGSALIDLSTISNLELIRNLQNAKSKDSLFGLLNETLTPMGARFLRSNILQPSIDAERLQQRYDSLEELATKEEMFLTVRQALKNPVDTDRVLASLVVVPTEANLRYTEQSINNVLMLKAFVESIKPIWRALAGVDSAELQKIRDLCAPVNYSKVEELINDTLNNDVTYSRQPVELRNQRVYAIKAGVNEFIDVARQAYKEANEDAFKLVAQLKDEYDLSFELKFNSARQFCIRIPVTELENRDLPEVFINSSRKRNTIECQTLELEELNRKIVESHDDVVSISDGSIQDLIDDIRPEMHPLFKISESIAMLDMLASFAQLVTTRDYVKPEITPTLAIKAGRHPIRERGGTEKYISNDVYATTQHRFQIITGANMSGKSTYVDSIALMAVMAQIGCFVPAQYASFPLSHQVFARLATDDVGTSLSTFATEMREIAFVLRNIEKKSMVIIDELGRGTSTSDGLSIAIAIAEALIESGSFVWFVTHFHDLARILAERAGVVNLHLAIDIAPDCSQMKMLYQISDGREEKKFYGLTLAKAVGFPAAVIERATEVSKALYERSEARRNNGKVLAVAKRRKLILSLREQLLQARQGKMKGEGLAKWLRQLQNEFVVRMMAIDAESAAAEPGHGSDVESADVVETEEEEVREQVENEMDPQSLASGSGAEQGPGEVDGDCPEVIEISSTSDDWSGSTTG